MLLSVIAVEMLTPDIKAVRLAAEDGGMLPTYLAGAHIELSIPLRDLAVQRKYSLVSDPAELRFYDIAVKRNINGRGGSAHLHDKVGVGDTLEVAAPANEFSLRNDASHHVLIAGGIGITPLLGMAGTAEREGRSYELHYSAQDERAMAFRAPVAALSRASVYFSQGEPAGRLDIAAILGAHKEDADAHLYVCGPARLIDDVRWCAEALGYPARRIHFESFGPAWTAGDGPVQLVLSDSSIELSVQPGVTLLDAMEEAGAWIPSECKRGECGTCITSYTGGAPLHRDNCLTLEQRAHSFCPCVSWADAGSVLTLQI